MESTTSCLSFLSLAALLALAQVSPLWGFVQVRSVPITGANTWKSRPTRVLSADGAAAARHGTSTTTVPACSNATAFMRAFPRYRIELTREKDIVDERPQLQWPWQTSARERNTTKEEDGTAFLYYPKVTEPVETLKILWQSLAEITAQTEGLSELTITFSNAPVKTVRQWVDMVDWMNQEKLTNIVATFCSKANGVQIVNSVPQTEKETTSTTFPEHAIITERTKAWVRRILVDMGICPFTKSTTRSGHGVEGVPVAKIAYHTSTSTNVPALLADAWTAMDAMLQAGPYNVSSILMAAPAFDDDFGFWAGPIFTLLETSVVVADATDDLGVVCFHPQYQTPDGSSWPGFGHMHSVPRLISFCNKQLSEEQVAEGGAWQRRTPHATINVLRADQLAAAEGKRSTPDLYAENIGKLLAIADGLPGALERERNMDGSD